MKKERNSWTENVLTVGKHRMGGRESQGVRDGHVHTGIFKMDNQQRPTIQHMELCSVYVVAQMGGEFGGDGCMNTYD